MNPLWQTNLAFPNVRQTVGGFCTAALWKCITVAPCPHGVKASHKNSDACFASLPPPPCFSHAWSAPVRFLCHWSLCQTECFYLYMWQCTEKGRGRAARIPPHTSHQNKRSPRIHSIPLVSYMRMLFLNIIWPFYL